MSVSTEAPLGLQGQANTPSIEVIHQRLLAPFPKSETEVRPGNVSGSQAKPLFYVDPRAYAKRLNQVFGLDGWSVEDADLTFGGDSATQYEWNREKHQREIIGTKQGLLVGCKVRIKVHTPYLDKVVSEVGEKGLDAASDNKVTSAYAQAFKRASTLLGLGAYLYYIDMGMQSYNKNNGFPFTVPPDDVMEDALRNAGFKGICEVTGTKVRWTVAAYSMHVYGQVLCEEECAKRKASEA